MPRKRRADWTESEAKKNRAALERYIEAGYKRGQREKLRALRARIRAIKRRRTLWQKAARNRYRRLRVELRARLKERRARTLARLRKHAELARLRLREEHTARRARIRKEFADLDARARKLLAEERRYQKALRSDLAASELRKAKRSSGRERAQESDDEVRRNLSAAERVVFDKVKRQIKPGPRRTRTEAFLEWMQENPDEAGRIHAAAVEYKPGELDRLEREYYEREKGLRPARVRKVARDHAGRFLGNGKQTETLEEYLAGVPF